MKLLGPTLLQEDAFSEIVIGNTALVRAMIESNVRAVTSYPGSPTPEIATAINSIPHEQRPFYFEFSTNEKVALELAFGAAINGHTSVSFFKSVGLNVASDSFMQLPLMQITGGMVIILGDDPGANSSQNEQDNRHYAKMSYMPLLEPATALEAYEMTKEAVTLARKHKTCVIVRMTTHVCHAKEHIQFSAWKKSTPDDTPLFDPDAWDYLPMAKSVMPVKRAALQRLEVIRTEFENAPSNHIINNHNANRGIIAAGLGRLPLLDILDHVDTPPDVLELGTIHPLPTERIISFLKEHKEVKILEELDPLLEQEIKALAYDRGLSTKIIGKQDIEEQVDEYLPDKVYGILAATWPDMVAPRVLPAVPGERVAPIRPAQMCPGCGHRSAFFAIKKALGEKDITVGDIGCHALGHLPPYNIGRVVLSMGHSTSTASGLSLFNTERKVVCFIGDSTFFHSGLPAVTNAVFNNHNVTLIVMENGTTAMTGHQDHPGVGKNVNGPTTAIPVRQALEGLGVTNIREVDAYQGAKLTAMVQEAIQEEGFKVIIAKHPCMLKMTREARRKPGHQNRHVTIDQAQCTQAHTCVSEFGCPSFQLHEDGTVTVSTDLCIGDGSCKQTCPSKAIVHEGKKS